MNWDTALKILIAIFCPLVVTSLIAVAKALLTLYTTLRDHEKKLQDDSDDIKKICDQLKVMKETYNNDRVERNSLMTMATSIDTKIDAKLKDILVLLAEQRREDSERLTKVITDQNQLFSNSVSELNNTLGKINVKLDFFDRDLKDMKGSQK